MLEFGSWGWNWMTFSFFGLIVMMFIRAWGHFHQARRVWTERSGRSLSVLAYVYSVGSSSCSVAYGASIGSLAMVLGSSVSIMLMAPTVVGLWKYRGVGRKGYALAAIMVALVAAIALTPYKDVLYFVSTFGIMVSVWLTPIEMFRNKDAGVVEVRLILAGLANSTFWGIYAFAIHNWVIMILNPVFLSAGSLQLFLWWRYRRPTVRKAVV